jgi:hypothetical protein
MFPATHATIVVSQPRRFSTSLMSARLSRSQASWTAVVGLAERAEHRVGDRAKMRSVLPELPGAAHLAAGSFPS